LAPFEREPLYNLSRCLAADGHPQEAEVCLARVKRIDEDRKRLDAVKAAVMTNPHDASLRCEMGLILLRNGQDREGVRWLRSALHEDPRCEAARRALEEHERRLTEAAARAEVQKD
jgi:hypothetical protein